MLQFIGYQVNSSQIEAIGHDPVLNKMAVEFKSKNNGTSSVYVYDSVPKAIFDRIMTAPSIGKSFGDEIKSKSALFPFKQLTGIERATVFRVVKPNSEYGKSSFPSMENIFLSKTTNNASWCW